MIETLEEQRRSILACYRREIAALARHLTQSTSRVGVAPEIHQRVERYGAQQPDTLESISSRLRDMPYLVLLKLIEGRLPAIGEPAAYRSPDELLADLRLIANSLKANKGERAGLFNVRRLLQRVETFGFHLATVDVPPGRRGPPAGDRRGGSAMPNGASGSAAERAARLGRELASGDSAPRGDDAELERTLDVFRALATARRRFGHRSVGLYIISMARSVDDVLSVLLLARWAGLVETDEDGGDIVPLDVAAAVRDRRRTWKPEPAPWRRCSRTRSTSVI